MISMHFGEHLTIDGYGGDPKKLGDRDVIFKCLRDLPEKTGMRRIMEPEVKSFSGNDNKDPGGYSGFVMIAESHISVHTFPKRRFISADVYTCKNGMDTDFILKYFKKKFNLKDIETNFIKRGTRYPKENLY